MQSSEVRRRTSSSRDGGKGGPVRHGFLEVGMLGYDIGARSTVAQGVDETCKAGHSTYTFAPLVGEPVDAGASIEFSEQQVCG